MNVIADRYSIVRAKAARTMKQCKLYHGHCMPREEVHHPIKHQHSILLAYDLAPISFKCRSDKAGIHPSSLREASATTLAYAVQFGNKCAVESSAKCSRRIALLGCTHRHETRHEISKLS
eukprot:scaffold2295_cov93-Skeletonema_dohrnii-CCMP3373.AAC.4